MAKATKTSKRPAAKAVKARNKPRKKIARVFRPIPEGEPTEATPAVLDRLWNVVMQRRDADPALSHSARLMSRGTPKIAQKFGEEAVECLIEAVSGQRSALISESADVLYHLLVMWVDAGLRPEQVWAELSRREGMSGIAEKAARKPVLAAFKTTKIP